MALVNSSRKESESRWHTHILCQWIKCEMWDHEDFQWAE